MKLSAKTRYGIAALTYMHIEGNEIITLQSISEHLNVSKLYLEQIFSHLKQAKLIDSIKGPTGGYLLTSKSCTMYDILYALEPALFEKTPASTDDDIINAALCEHLYSPIDRFMKDKLSSISLSDVANSIANLDEFKN